MSDSGSADPDAVEHLRELDEYLRQLDWTESDWYPSAALVHKSSQRVSLFVGQRFGREHIALVEQALGLRPV